MILEIDAGNTRIKWRLCNGRQVLERGFGSPENMAGMFDELAARPAIPVGGPLRVRVASVRGGAFEHSLQALLLDRWGVLPEFARSTVSCGPVVNGYEQPSALGVDRWLAAIAAYDYAPQSCCVIDAGSAITLDLVSAQGRHEGGYIVPGLVLQRESFLTRTGLRLDAEAEWTSVAPGLRTSDALDNGILAMVTGWLVFLLKGGGAGRALYLTGGDASVLSEQLGGHNVRHLVVPDLVLDGLALALP